MLKLSEDEIFTGFHNFLQTCFELAKRENLLDAANPDTLVSGSALGLFYAAIMSSDPPSIPIPPASELNPYTTPPSLVHFTNQWVKTVPLILALPSKSKRDVARIICDLEPHCSNPLHPGVGRISADLKALAMELCQRKQFQELFGDGLSLAATIKRNKALVRTPLIIPPTINTDDNTPTILTQPGASTHHSAPSSPSAGSDLAFHASPLNYLAVNGDVFPPSKPKASAPTPTPSYASSSRRTLSTFVRHSDIHFPSASSSILFPGSPRPSVPPVIMNIRETLYGAVAEVLTNHPRLRNTLIRDPPRAYFSIISLALLSVSLSSLSASGLSIVTVLGTDLSASDLPVDYFPDGEGSDYRSFLEELMGIGRQARKMIEEDDERAVAYVARGRDIPNPRLDRLNRILEKGIGYVDEESGKTRGEKHLAGKEYGTTMNFALRVSQLAMRVLKMRSLFRDEQGIEIMSVLTAFS